MNLHRGIQTLRPALFLTAATAAMAASYGQVPAAGPAAQNGESWPQRFELNGTEPASFGFAVTQPGEIQVDVQAQGAPLRVALIGPARQENVGTGHITLRYVLTAADAQRGALWYVRVSLQNAPAAPGRPLAGGNISVRHPAADAALVQQQMNAAVAQHQALRQRLSARMAADIQAKQRARQLELAKYHDN